MPVSMQNLKQKIKEEFAARPDNAGVLPNENCSSYEAEVAECRVYSGTFDCKNIRI